MLCVCVYLSVIAVQCTYSYKQLQWLQIRRGVIQILYLVFSNLIYDYYYILLIVLKMSERKCVASNCGAVFHTFKFPKADGLRQQWIQFVTERKEGYIHRVSHRLCFRHFHTEHFSNYREYQEANVTR